MSDFRFTRPNRFPPVVKNLIIVNVLVFVAQLTLREKFPLENWFALHDVRSVFFQPHQLITYLFMHAPDNFGHILFNMLALWMFGATLENFWGPRRFLIYYLVCGVAAGALHLAVLYYQLTPYFDTFHHMPVADQLEAISAPNVLNQATIGASGAVFGLLAAYGYLFPNSLIYVYFAIPIKAKWFVIIYAAIELGLGIQNSAGDNVAHFAHLGGALAGIILVLIWNKTNRKTLY